MNEQQIIAGTARDGKAGAPLAGQRALVIEDEGLVSVLIEDILLDSGCAIAGTASSLAEALDKVETLAFDFAIVDVNLNGLQSAPVAEALVERGVPFVLATGYGATSCCACTRTPAAPPAKLCGPAPFASCASARRCCAGGEPLPLDPLRSP